MKKSCSDTGVSEIGDINRFSSADKLAKYAGISPVSYSFGKTDKLLCNVLGDRKLNRVFFTLAVTVVNCAGDSGKPVNEIFHRYYKKKIFSSNFTIGLIKYFT